ncbi:uncharacterized protein [Engystomops pustulosus]|uniref:uncharacterized protein n=1 Tax=Engystomops pustulosus TaxID=76066 RepID=UPI003AFA5A4B
MDDDCSHLSQKILRLTLEIIYLLTGEDCTVVRKTSGEAAMFPQPTALLQQGDYSKEILQLTNQILQLLSGEVPLRCEDVTVHFSMEEWDYVEEHESLYKDLIRHDQHYRSKATEEKSSDQIMEGTEIKEEDQEDHLDFLLPTTDMTPDLSSRSPKHSRASHGTSESIPRLLRDAKSNKSVIMKPTLISPNSSDLPSDSHRKSGSPPDTLTSSNLPLNPKSNELSMENPLIISEGTDFPCTE